MKAVTIDQLDMKDHVRWANDQQQYDISFINESHLIAPHPEILGTSSIYASKLEELFEMQKKNVSWAFFSQPKNFYLFSRHFFSYRLFPSIFWDEGAEDDNEVEEQESFEGDGNSVDLIKEVMNLKKAPHHNSSIFEKDKTVILNLLESIKGIDRMLLQINVRKLQYQKG